MDFQITRRYPCSYLPGELARSRIVVTDDTLSDSNTYAQLIQQGYRRSGSLIYRPDCDYCHACIPVRIPVELFDPNRTQRRIWKRHQHLQIAWHPLHFDPVHFDLYQRYQKSRHTNGSMDQDDENGRKQYRDFLLKSTVDSFLVTFHEWSASSTGCRMDCHRFIPSSSRMYPDRVTAPSTSCGRQLNAVLTGCLTFISATGLQTAGRCTTKPISSRCSI